MILQVVLSRHHMLFDPHLSSSPAPPGRPGISLRQIFSSTYVLYAVGDMGVFGREKGQKQTSYKYIIYSAISSTSYVVLLFSALWLWFYYQSFQVYLIVATSGSLTFILFPPKKKEMMTILAKWNNIAPTSIALQVAVKSLPKSLHFVGPGRVWGP